MIYPELPLKAISVRQPWSWAIVHAGKRLENRSWYCRYRDPVCIHAAKGMGKAEYKEAAEFITTVIGRAPNQEWLDRWHGVCAAPYRLEHGGIIGVADIVDCISESDDPWFMGPYGIVLDNVRPVPFVPVKGALGFFDWRKNLEGLDGAG